MKRYRSDDYYADCLLQAQAVDYQITIDDLIDELKDQNLEIVALRRLLLKYMNTYGKENMRTEIYDALYPQYCRLGIEAYILNDHDGIDPFEEPGYLRKLHDCARGRRTDGHPNIYSGALKPIR